MMLPSHLLATITLGLLLSRLRPFEAKEWALAFAFGVLVDLDHLLQVPRYAATHGGVASLANVGDVLRWGADWQGFFHTPWAALVVALACLGSASWVPAVFWGLHMVQDFVVARHLVPFGGGVEWAIVAALAASVLGLLALDHRAHAARVAFPGYVRERVALGVLSLATVWRR